MPSNETGSGATTSGGITFFQYYHVGPAEQVGVFGWGISQFGGTVTTPQTTTLMERYLLTQQGQVELELELF